MKQYKSLHQKIISLCKFLTETPVNTKNCQMNHYLYKCMQVGLPVSSGFTKERNMYNLAHAAITMLVQYQNGFQIAAVLLKGRGNSRQDINRYWDILHHLNQVQEQIRELYQQVEDVVQKLNIGNIRKCVDLNSKYSCHCVIDDSLYNNFEKCHKQKRSKSIKNPLIYKNQASHTLATQNTTKKNKYPVAIQLPINNINNKINTFRNKNNINFQQINQIESNSDIIQQISDNEVSERPQVIGEQFCILMQDNIQYNWNNCEEESSINIDNNQNVSNKILQNNMHKQNKINKRDLQCDIIDVQFISSCQQQISKQQIECNDNNQQVQQIKLLNIYKQPRKNSEIVQKKLYSNLNFNTNKQKLIQQKSNLKLQRCQLCLELYHINCQTQQQFLCNKCFVKQCSIKYRVINQLFCGYIYQNSYITSITFLCPNVQRAKLQCSDSFIVQLRLQFIGTFNRNITQSQSKANYQKQIIQNKNSKSIGKMTLYINCQPYPIKCPNSQSQIVSIKIPIKYLQQKNFILIQKNQLSISTNCYNLQKIKPSRVYLIGIYQVVPRSRRKQLINNTITKLRQNSLKIFYQSILKSRNQKYIKFSTLSAVSNKPMSAPVRSFHCRHPECFDYSQALQIINKKSSINRRTFIKRPSRKQIKSLKTQSNNINHIDIDQAIQTPKNKQKNTKNKINNDGLCPICGVTIKGVYLDMMVLQNNLQLLKSKQESWRYFLQIQDNQKRNSNINNNNNSIMIEISQQQNQESNITNNINQHNSNKNYNHNINLQQLQHQNQQLYYNVKPAIAFSDSDLQPQNNKSNQPLKQQQKQQQKKYSKMLNKTKHITKTRSKVKINQQNQNKRQRNQPTEICEISQQQKQQKQQHQQMGRKKYNRCNYQIDLESDQQGQEQDQQKLVSRYRWMPQY